MTDWQWQVIRALIRYVLNDQKAGDVDLMREALRRNE